MNQNPIHKVLSLIYQRGIKALLMGGQACVLYGAAEFSRDIDLAILTDSENIEKLKQVLKELEAEQIAVPPFDLAFLEKGHAIHFRAKAPGYSNIRLDIMSKLRGLPDFETLWQRRTSFKLSSDLSYELLSLQDLVNAKKTQRDKDWPMIKRLLEADYIANKDSASVSQQELWLRELRTAQFLIDLAKNQISLARKVKPERALISFAIEGKLELLEDALSKEEQEQRSLDRSYWQPLKKELEQLRYKK